MELFLDDPNNDIDTAERNTAKFIHILGFVGTFFPPFNFVLPFIYSKSKNQQSLFVKDHTTNALNFQLLVLIFIFIGLGLYFILDFFYVLLYMFFIVLFQTINTYNAYIAAKTGTINKYPISQNIF